MSANLERARRAGVVAVIRAPSAMHAVETSRALIRGGVTGIEITFSTPDASGAIADLVAEFADSAWIGAGTVTSAAHAVSAAEAGAQFLVSPGSTPAVVSAMRETELLTMAGAFTASEVMHAVELGADVVKVFPASLGGPGYLRALRGPFPDVAFMPSGGVSADNLDAWFAAGVVAVAAGGELANSVSITAQNWADLEDRAARFAAAFSALRG